MSFIGALLLLFVLWIAPIMIATGMGNERNRAGLGITLGIFLGWLGVLIMAFVSPTPEAQRQQLLDSGRAFRCPFCREPVRTGATVCPHCQRDLPPAES